MFLKIRRVTFASTYGKEKTFNGTFDLMNTQVSDLIGIPWTHKGRTLAGLDCLGLIKITLKRLFDFELPEYEYTEDWYDQGHNYMYDRWCEVFKSTKTISLGDVLFYQIVGDVVHHLAVYIDYGRVIHTFKKTGVIITPVSKMTRFHRFTGRIQLNG